MIRPVMLRRWREWLRTHFDTRAIIAGVVAGIFLLLLTGLVAALTGIAEAVWNALEDAYGQIEDVLQQRVRVWQVVAVNFGVLAAVVAATILLRRLSSRPPPSYREVPRFDVLWPMIGVIDLSTTSRRPSRFQAQKPSCPKDQTPLGWVIFTNDDGKDEVVALHDDDWRELGAQSMEFRCFECDKPYDLRKYGYGMARATEIVEEVALGTYRRAMEVEAKSGNNARLGQRRSTGAV